MRIRDCWHRPTTGVPGRRVKVLERYSNDYNKTFCYTGRQVDCLNFSSYNYLGFAAGEGSCVNAVCQAIDRYGIGSGSTRPDGGGCRLHEELEAEVAKFVGCEAAMVFGMGFATNSAMLSALVDKGCLIISDALNHSSLVFGSRQSGATIRVFHHNNVAHLEEVLREAISQGQPRNHRPWRKILVIVEGLYSMEGDMCPLPQLVQLRQRYKFMLFVDEAHSIGALGPRGRGVCDLFNVDPKQVDILMGTFTKSFGASGGYLAGNTALIERLRRFGLGYTYAEPMPPPICQQVISSLRIIAGEDGTDEGLRRLNAIRENSIYFMRRLKELGFAVLGQEGSPVIPVLIYNPAKIAAVSREALSRGMALVVVGYPATPVISSRIRFCISASHTRADLEEALSKMTEIGDILLMRPFQK